MDNQHTQGQEETMLGLLWNHPELIISVWGIINEDDFMGEKTREFYAFLASLYQQHISGQSKILAIVPPGLQETIASARKRIEESTDSADLVKTAVQCAVRIKKSRLLQINVELTLWNHRGVKAFRSALEVFEVVQERLRYVAIDNRDTIATIRRNDSAKTLFYIDPPYFGVEQYYEASRYTVFPHEEMADVLNSCQGMVALSYYPDPELDRLYPVSKWRRITWEQPKSSDIQSEKNAIATEVLLMNYSQVESLWEIEA